MNSLDLEAKFLRDGDPGTFDRLVAAHWPLVMSICRTTLRDEHEAQDAAQETFLKLLTRRGQIHGRLVGWLTTAARTTCLDRLRQQRNQSRRRQRWQTLQPDAHHQARLRLRRHLLRTRLPEALLEIDAHARTLLTQRLIQGQPLRIVASRMDVSLPTASRRIAAALDQLAVVFTEMGLLGKDDLALSQLLADQPDETLLEYHRDTGLRHHPYWQRRATQNFPGWTRPLRVGVHLGYAYHMIRNAWGFASYIDHQAVPAKRFDHPAIETVGLVDPNTSDQGIIEVGLRDFELTAGLIDITDRPGLETLDVIITGHRVIHRPELIRTINAAVRSGVGHYHEGHCVAPQDAFSDPDLCAFCLAQPPLEHYCSGVGSDDRHNLPVPGRITSAHPAVPWLRPGDPITLTSCGLVFKPVPDTTVIAVRDQPIQSTQPVTIQLPGHVPAILAGTSGAGRVFAVHQLGADMLYGVPPGRPDRFVQTLRWLAEPRRRESICLTTQR